MNRWWHKTGTYLDAIVADVRRRVNDDLADIDGAAQAYLWRRERNSLIAAIEGATAVGRLGIIAEVKRCSPSRGAIDEALDPAGLAARYVEGGAIGVSVLTEQDHFGGSPDDLRAVRHALAEAPLLRKDFTIHSVQVVDSPELGADAILLIAALYPEVEALIKMVDFARLNRLEVLLEVHDEAELERALQTDARLIGINNRDLRSFEVDLAVTEQLAPLIPADRLIVSESGISTPADAARVRAAGAHAALVGETLVRASDPAALVHELSEAGR